MVIVVVLCIEPVPDIHAGAESRGDGSGDTRSELEPGGHKVEADSRIVFTSFSSLPLISDISEN